jgi:hypothetical protein
MALGTGRSRQSLTGERNIRVQLGQICSTLSHRASLPNQISGHWHQHQEPEIVRGSVNGVLTEWEKKSCITDFLPWVLQFFRLSVSGIKSLLTITMAYARVYPRANKEQVQLLSSKMPAIGLRHIAFPKSLDIRCCVINLNYQYLRRTVTPMEYKYVSARTTDKKLPSVGKNPMALGKTAKLCVA